MYHASKLQDQGAIVAPTSEVYTVIMLICLMAELKVRRWGVYQWHDVHTDFH